MGCRGTSGWCFITEDLEIEGPGITVITSQLWRWMERGEGRRGGRESLEVTHVCYQRGTPSFGLLHDVDSWCVSVCVCVCVCVVGGFVRPAVGLDYSTV